MPLYKITGYKACRSYLPPYCFCYFAISTHDPVPSDASELCLLSHMGGTARAETFAVSFIDFQKTKHHLHCCLHIAVILTLNTLTDNNMWHGLIC